MRCQVPSGLAAKQDNTNHIWWHSIAFLCPSWDDIALRGDVSKSWGLHVHCGVSSSWKHPVGPGVLVAGGGSSRVAGGRDGMVAGGRGVRVAGGKSGRVAGGRGGRVAGGRSGRIAGGRGGRAAGGRGSSGADHGRGGVAHFWINSRCRAVISSSKS